MSVNIKVTGGLNRAWGQIDPKAGVLTLFQHASYVLCDQVKAIDRQGGGGASETHCQTLNSRLKFMFHDGETIGAKFK